MLFRKEKTEKNKRSIKFYYKLKIICWDKILHEVNYWVDMHAYNRVFGTSLCPQNSTHKIGIFVHFLCLKHRASLLMSLPNISNHLSHLTDTICCCISFVNTSWQTYKKQILSLIFLNYSIMSSMFRSNFSITPSHSLHLSYTSSQR